MKITSNLTQNQPKTQNVQEDEKQVFKIIGKEMQNSIHLY